MATREGAGCQGRLGLLKGQRCRLTLVKEIMEEWVNLFLLKILVIYFYREEEEKKREGEKHHCVVASHTHATEDLAHNPGLCPDWESNWGPFGSQARTHSTEPHQPG